MGDKTIQCKDCGDDFTWTEGQQDFYREKGLDPPRRCPFCRQELKRKRKQVAMRGEVQHER